MDKWFFGQNKYTNIRRFSTIFRPKTRIFSLQKVQKIQFLVTWIHNIYLTKAKSRTLSLFIEHSNINIVQNFGHTQNKSIIYRSGIYNLQTRTLTFPEQEKLLEKLNLRYLKMLKTKKLKTKNPQMKYFPCLTYEMIYRRDLHKLQTRKKQLKK